MFRRDKLQPFLVLMFFLSLPTKWVNAQESAILQSYIQEGLQYNLGIQSGELEIQKATQRLNQAKSLSKFKLGFEANYTVAAGGRKLDFPIGDLLNPVYNTLNFLTQSQSFPEVENTSIQFLPNNFHETKLNFALPIYNTDVRFNQKIQTSLVAGKSSMEDAKKLSLKFDITEAYIKFLQTWEAEKIWQNNRKVLSELKRFNESLVRNGVATEDIVATADFELAKVDNAIFELQSNRNSARAYFNYLLGKDQQSEVMVDSALFKRVVPEYNLDEALESSMSKRNELRGLENFMEAAETNSIREGKNKRLPELYLGGSFGFQGFGYTFNKEQAYALAQVGLTYDLLDGKLQKNKIQESRLDYQIATKQLDDTKEQIKLQTTLAWNELQAAKFSWQSAEKNVLAAESIYRIVNNKYRAGQALLLEFLEAEARRTNAHMTKLLAWSEVLTKEAAFRKAVGK